MRNAVSAWLRSEGASAVNFARPGGNGVHYSGPESATGQTWNKLRYVLGETVGNIPPRGIMQRKHSIPHSLDDRLAAEKKQLEEQAALLPPGSVKDVVLRKIGQLNAAIHINELLKPPGSPE
jgi:hypothetical protein